LRESLHIQESHQKERDRETQRRRSVWRSLASISSTVQFCRDLDSESLRWSLRGNLGKEEEDKNDVAPLSSNGKSITISPPTTTTFPSPLPSGGDSADDNDDGKW